MKINKKPSIDLNTNLNNIQNNQRKENLKILNQKICLSKAQLYILVNYRIKILKLPFYGSFLLYLMALNTME